MQHPLTHWIPYKLTFEQNEPIVKWLFVGNKTYSEPFFDETILRCKSLPENSTFFSSSSTLSWLIDAGSKLDFLPPDGLIFHVSRCGSTLLSQLLNVKPETICLSEVPFIDEVLMLQGAKIHTSETKSEIVDAAVKLLGKKRDSIEKHLFLKLDSWHLFYYELLRELYPNTPFYFMYRHPAEVLNSHKKNRGIHMVPGFVDPELLGLKSNGSVNDLDLFGIQVLENYFRKLLAIKVKNDPYSYFLNYNQGSHFHIEIVAGYSGINFSDAELAEIKKRSTFHSKFPEQVFSEPANTQVFSDELANVIQLYDALDQKINTELSARVSQQESVSFKQVLPT